METKLWESRPPADWEERAGGEVARLNQTPQLVGEYKVVVLPHRASHEPLSALASEVVTKRADAVSLEVDATARLPGLGLVAADSSRFGSGERPVDRDEPLVQVDVPPVKGEQLSSSHPSSDREHIDRLEAVAPGLLQKRGRFMR